MDEEWRQFIPLSGVPRILLLHDVVGAPKCLSGRNNDLGWPIRREVSASSFPDKSGTNVPTTEGWKAWMAWLGKLNQEPGIGCTGGTSYYCATRFFGF